MYHCHDRIIDTRIRAVDRECDRVIVFIEHGHRFGAGKPTTGRQRAQMLWVKRRLEEEGRSSPVVRKPSLWSYHTCPFQTEITFRRV